MNDYFRTILELMEYERWCNLRAMDFLERLPDEQCKRDFGFGLKTPHRTMFHIADVMQGWSRSVAPTITAPSWLHYDQRVSLEWIRSVLIEAADDLMLAAHSSNERGVLGADRRLTQLFHLVTHGTHHRGQLLSMLTLLGYAQPFEGGDFGGWSAKQR
jgi:uncharacterized damage-inducible protein DinB